MVSLDWYGGTFTFISFVQDAKRAAVAAIAKNLLLFILRPFKI
jgi:hypothetical protein